MASAAYQTEIQNLNAHLRTRLPDISWHAIGIVITWQYQILTKRFVAFDPTRTHGGSGEGRGVTIILYTPTRIPTEEQMTQLRLLGFPTRQVSTPLTPGQLQGNRRQQGRGIMDTTHPDSEVGRVQPNPEHQLPNCEGVSVLAPTSDSDSASESGLHIRTTTTSGNGFGSATPVTPEWHSDDQTTSRSLASTILEDTPHSEPRNLEDASACLDRDLQGGGSEEDGDDSIGRAVQRTRLLTQKYTKKQLRIIFKIEPRTTRRVLQAGQDEYDQQRTIQMVEAAGRRLTLTVTEKPMTQKKPARPHTSQMQDNRTQGGGAAD